MIFWLIATITSYAIYRIIKEFENTVKRTVEEKVETEEDKFTRMLRYNYLVLNLPLYASKNEIKKAYHKLALKYHPDINKNGTEKFLEIKKAYETLMEI